MRWNELKGQLNGAFFYEKREQLHDADLTTGFRIKALKNWPLILDFDLGWTNYNYVDSISNTTRLPMVNNVILQPHLWYVLSNSATTTSAVWHRMVLDADLDVRTMQDQRASSEFNAGIRYDMKSSDLNIPAQDQTFETWVGAGIGCRYLNSIKNNYADQWFADGFFIIGKKTVQTLLNFGVKIDLPGVGLKVEYEPRANRVSNWAILLNEPLNFLN
jgi:hypothetical protein